MWDTPRKLLRPKATMPPFLTDAGAAGGIARRRPFPRIRLTMLPPHRLSASRHQPPSPPAAWPATKLSR